MKIRLTVDIELRMGCGPETGMSLAGYMPDGTTYKDLVWVFGKPRPYAFPCGKTRVEWPGKINGLEFIIYDYKSPVPPEKNTDWHIAARSEVTAKLVAAYFRAMR
ncbi:MAG: hypothetical protein WC421_11570 [Elusimicrobiales bacterium]